ncbi:TetR/AcrR family transcriptional regulator [Gluconacetobacter sp. Hr-1-5]|uniref:TetR/AcrR family transcriptional regulator n=1 Tax=Gluconacetobacter sp. Hr-1-5 TaxID=3395370 RepID=UPI003B524667
MGRSSQEQAIQNRANIVEAASRLFRQHGVDHVSVADIMGSLGMTTGGFYKHFTSKDALVAEAFALAFRQSAASWRKVSQQNGAGAIVHHYFRKRPAEQNCPILAFAPHVETENAAGQCVQAYTRGAETLFAQFLDHMKPAADGTTDPQAGQDAEILFAAMVGARLLADATGDSEWAKSVEGAVQGAVSRLR